MAKSNLDLRGGKSRNLELDYLRLAYVVSSLRLNGLDAVGYLFVATGSAKKRTERWEIKYAAKSHVKVITDEEFSKKEISKLKVEKQNNARGLRCYGNRRLSIAKEGDIIGRRKLKEAIEKDNPGVVDLTDKEELLPMQIRWDYYGEIRTT